VTPSSSIFRLCTLLSLFVAAESYSAERRNASTPSGFETFVSSVYKQHAWVTVFGNVGSSPMLTPLLTSPLRELKKVFAPDLAAAIFKDTECGRKSGGVCALESDILFGAQDPDARDLVVRKKATDRAEVCFNEQNKLRCFEISGIKTGAAGWRIADITYDKAEQSLRSRLKLKTLGERGGVCDGSACAEFCSSGRCKMAGPISGRTLVHSVD
jgi:hypothetical protein